MVVRIEMRSSRDKWKLKRNSSEQRKTEEEEKNKYQETDREFRVRLDFVLKCGSEDTSDA